MFLFADDGFKIKQSRNNIGFVQFKISSLKI